MRAVGLKVTLKGSAGSQPLPKGAACPDSREAPALRTVGAAESTRAQGHAPTNPEPARCVCAGPPFPSGHLRPPEPWPQPPGPAPTAKPGGTPSPHSQWGPLPPSPRVQPPQGAPDSAQFQVSFGETFAHSPQASLAPLSSPRRWRTTVCYRPWLAAAGAGPAGSAHCPSRVRESLADLCPLIPGMDPSSHGQSTHPGTDLAASRVLGAGASAINAHSRILQPPGQRRRPDVARGSEPACLPASRLLENTRAKMNMLGAFLLGFVDKEWGVRGEKGPAHGHTAGMRSRRDWNWPLQRPSSRPLHAWALCLLPSAGGPGRASDHGAPDAATVSLLGRVRHQALQPGSWRCPCLPGGILPGI